MVVVVRKRGRPKKAEADRRSAALLAWFTPREAEAIVSLAREKRRSISELIRFACRKTLLDRRGARVSHAIPR